MPFPCQSSFGPSSGHSFTRPVSLETWSRFGPPHCGQSAATAAPPHASPARTHNARTPVRLRECVIKLMVPLVHPNARRVVKRGGADGRATESGLKAISRLVLGLI